MRKSALPQEDRYWYRPLLGYGERVLWQGKPEKYSLLKKEDILQVPFSIVWCGFAIWWEYIVVTHDTPILFAVTGALFVCVGLYITAGRFLWRSFALRHTEYIITDRRILRRTVGRIKTLEGCANLPVLTEYKEDGFGTIRFREPAPNWRYRFSWSAEPDGFALVGIRDVRMALSAVERMRRIASERG